MSSNEIWAECIQLSLGSNVDGTQGEASRNLTYVSCREKKNADMRRYYVFSPGIYVVWIGAFVAGILNLIRSCYYCTMTVSSIEGEP